MSKSNGAGKIPIYSVDDLLGISSPDPEEKSSGQEGRVTEIPLAQLHTFESKYGTHPFRVLDDIKMAETVESIKQYGVLMPGIVRPRLQGGYEIIAGHRRNRACQLAELLTMSVIIKDLTDEEAAIIMVDSNIQREDLLYSEKAFAYKIRMEAEKERRSRKETGAEKDKNRKAKRSDEVLAEQIGESRNTIQRYIRLTELIPELLEMVDLHKVVFTAGVELSYLKKMEQQILFDFINAGNRSPSEQQAARLKEYSKKGTFNEDVMKLLLLQDKPEPNKVTLKRDTLSQYFPKNYTSQQMEEVIFQLLEEWSNQQ